MAKKTRIVSKEVAVLLRRIKKDLDAKLVYVLVDHLRETDHPLAKYVADKVERHGNMVGSSVSWQNWLWNRRQWNRRLMCR